MAIASEQIGHSALVGGGQTALHSHADGGGGVVTYYAESSGEDSTTSTSWQEKLSYGVTDPGDYLVHWTFELRGSSTQYHTRAQVLHNANELANPQQEPRDVAPAEYNACAGFRKLTLDAGDSITINWCSENAGGTAYIRYAAIFLMKL